MILSTLSISSHGFAFGFPKRPHTNEDVFLTYKLMINPFINQCGTPLPTILPSNKVHHRAPLRPMEPSNILSLIEAWLLLWSPRTKYTLCSTLESLLTTLSRLTTSLFDIWGSYWHTPKSRAWLSYHNRNKDPPQWYDIEHFKNKFSWFCFLFPQKASYQWRCIPYL